MAGLDGLKEILIGADPGGGVNPDVGYIYKWVESAGGGFIYKYKTSAGVVGNIGSSGGAVVSVNSGTGITVDNTDPVNPIINAAPITTFSWMLQAGNSNLPSNGTESSFSYGNNSANDGVTMMRDGNIIGMSVRVEPARSAGSANFILTINNINNNIAGQRIVIDASNGVEGQLGASKGALIFPVPIAYIAGDQIEVRAITSGWNPTSADSTVLVHMEDTL